MLRFACPPDAVFTAILSNALDMVQDEFGDSILSAADKAEFWTTQYSNTAKVLNLATAAEAVSQLLSASASPDIYDLTDYHWLLLYDILRIYIDIHNDLARDNGGLFRVGPYQVGLIDFDTILDTFFWDTDFLLDGDELAAIGEEGRASLGLNKETFGLTQGLAPHPDELRLVVSEDSPAASDEPVPPAGSVIREYPNLDGEQYVVFEPPPRSEPHA